MVIQVTQQAAFQPLNYPKEQLQGDILNILLTLLNQARFAFFRPNGDKCLWALLASQKTDAEGDFANPDMTTDDLGLEFDHVADMEFAKTVIRSEIVLRYPKMKVLEMTKPRDWTLAKLKAELVSAFDKLHLSGRVRVGLSALDLRDVKHMYRTTYRCWEHGDDLRVLLEPKALKRQIAYFESIGFDITTPPPVSGEEIPLGDIFTLSNAVEPPPELWGDDDDAEAVEC